MTGLEIGYKQREEDGVKLRGVGNKCPALGAVGVVVPFNSPFCPFAF